MALTLDPQTAVRGLAHAHRSVRFILAAVFALDVLTAMIVTGYGNSYLLDTLDAPPEYPAFALGVYGLVKFATAPPGGWLIDHAQPAVSLGLAGTLLTGGVLVMLAVGTAEGFIAGSGILSAGVTLFWLIVFHVLAASVPLESRGIASANLGIVSAVSIGLGFVLAALLAESASTIVFVIGIALAFATAALLWPARPRDTRAREQRREDGRRVEEARDARTEAVAGAVVFMHFLAVNGTIVAISPFALDLLDLSLLQLSLLLAPAAAAGGITMLVVGRRSRLGYRLRESAPLYLIGAGALLLTAVTSHWAWFGLGMTAAGVAMGGTTPLQNSARIDLSTLASTPGQVLGRLIFAEGLGSVLGPVAVGIVIAVGDIRAGAVAAGFIFAALALLTSAAGRAVRL